LGNEGSWLTAGENGRRGRKIRKKKSDWQDRKRRDKACKDFNDIKDGTGKLYRSFLFIGGKKGDLMKASHGEGAAIHTGPESCRRACKDALGNVDRGKVWAGHRSAK